MSEKVGFCVGVSNCFTGTIRARDQRQGLTPELQDATLWQRLLYEFP
jgi:hypothetical protein